MVDLMSLLSDALIGSFQMFMLNDFGKNMFPYRIKTCWKRILIYGVTALVILSVNHIESTFINIMMIPVSYTIASIVIFQGSVWKKIILACCYYMLAIVPEFLFAVITGAYGVTGTENNFHSELEKLLSLLLMSTITFLLVKCVNQITRKKNYQTIENKLFTVLLTLPAATIIIFMCIYYSQISYTGVNRIMIPIGAALLLMTNICIFAVFDKLIEKSEEVKKMELLYQKSKAENINQKYINKVNEDKRVFLHDVNKFLCTAASLIENGKNLELDSIKTIDMIDGKIILIAHSLGCRIAQMCLEEIYSSIQSVVLITPMPVRNNFLQLLQMSKKQRKNNLEYILFSERLDSERKEYYMSLLDKESKKVEYAMMKRQKKFSIYVRKIPTLVIGSYNDQCVILQAVKDNAKIHTAELKIVDSVCHDMMLDPDWRNIADLIFIFIEKTIDKKSGDNYNDNYVSTQAHQGGE